MVKSKVSSHKSLVPTQSCGYLRLLDPNYREKLFNLKSDQKEIFRKLTEKNIIPLRQANVNTNYFNQYRPFLEPMNSRQPGRVSLDSKLVNTVLDKIKFYMPPELLQTCAKTPLMPKQPLSPFKKKQSIDNFKTQLATTGSLARLLRSSAKEGNSLTTYDVKGLLSHRGLSTQGLQNHVSLVPNVKKDKYKGQPRRRIIIANIKNNKLVHENRRRARELALVTPCIEHSDFV